MLSPFDIRVYDKSLNLVCFLNDPNQVQVTVRHNAVGTADLFLQANHPKLDRVAVKGNRIMIKYYGDHLLSGMLRRFRVSGTQKSGIAQLGFDDDFRMFFTHLGWIRPDLDIGSQNTGGFKEDKITENAETVIKYFLDRNLVDRLGRPITIGPDLGRGAVVTVGLRMIPPSDKLITVADQASLGMTMQQVNAGFLFDVYQPRIFPHKLSEVGGTITSYDYGWDAPTATRTVVGNALEGTLRQFLVRSVPAREAEWGDVVETFTNASDTEVTTEMQARGDAHLTESNATSGLSVTLSESKHFRYGGANGFRVGDQVNFRVGNADFTDIMREVKISYTRDKGLQVNPTLGGWTNNPDAKFFKMIKKIQQGLRTVQAGR